MQLGLHRMRERLRVWADGLGFHASSRGPSYEGRGVLQNSPLDPPSLILLWSREETLIS